MTAPPRTAELLLESLGADPALRDATLGDLAEEFAQRSASDGVADARRWYWREALRTAPHLVRSWSRDAGAHDVGRLLGIAVTSYAFLLVVVALSLTTLNVALRAVGIDVRVEPLLFHGPLAILARVVFGAVSAVVGGYIAASLDERAPLVAALVLGVAWSAGGIVVAALAGEPAWQLVTEAVCVVTGTALGGTLRVRAHDRASHASA